MPRNRILTSTEIVLSQLNLPSTVSHYLPLLWRTGYRVLASWQHRSVVQTHRTQRLHRRLRRSQLEQPRLDNAPRARPRSRCFETACVLSFLSRAFWLPLLEPREIGLVYRFKRRIAARVLSYHRRSTRMGRETAWRCRPSYNANGRRRIERRPAIFGGRELPSSETVDSQASPRRARSTRATRRSSN